MSIRHIRWLQRFYQLSLMVTALFLMVFLGAILKMFHLPAQIGNAMSTIWLGTVLSSLSLYMIVRRVRCPVCRHIFVGKSAPTMLTSACRNCGRRSGDTD